MAGSSSSKSLTAPVVQRGTLYVPPPSKQLPARRFQSERKKQSHFLGALAETASVAEACHYVGATRAEVFEWRRDPAFAAAWNEAVTIARSVIVDAAVDRALHGAPRPILDKSGEVVAWVRRPSDALLATLLQNPHLLNS